MYLSSFLWTETEDQNENDVQWNEFRWNVLNKALREIYEGLEIDLRNELSIRAEEFVIKECQKAYEKLINIGPYHADDYERHSSKVFALATDSNVELFGVTAFVVLDSNGEVIEAHNFTTLTARNLTDYEVRDRTDKKRISISDNDRTTFLKEKRTIERLLIEHDPKYIIIGANCLHSLKIKKNLATYAGRLLRTQFKKNNVDWKIDEKNLLVSVPIIHMADTSISKLFASSQRGSRMFPDYDYFIKQAISLGRYYQYPLVETLGLWSDRNEQLTTLLSLHPHQKLVNQRRLEQALELTAADVVADYGADINDMIHHPHLRYSLQFIPGLGPIKAHYLIDNIYKRLHGKLLMRVSLVAKKIMQPRVYENCAGFIRIPISENETDPLDSTRIHPEYYELAKKVAESALEVKSERNDETIIYKIIEKPKLVELIDALDLQKYAEELAQRDPSKENIMEVFEFIKAELRAPFKLPDRKYVPPSYEQLLYLVSGESKQTLSEGSNVQVTVMDSDESKGYINTKLESGLLGTIDRKNIVDYKFQGDADFNIDFSQYKRGMTLNACVIKIRDDNKDPDDIIFKIDLSLKDSDFDRYKANIQNQLDKSFVISKEE